VSLCETSGWTSIPYFACACCMPSQLAWLKEWSSRPPESVTMRAQAAEDVCVGEAVGLGAEAQPASARAATAAGTMSFGRRAMHRSSRTRRTGRGRSAADVIGS